MHLDASIHMCLLLPQSQQHACLPAYLLSLADSDACMFRSYSASGAAHACPAAGKARKKGNAKVSKPYITRDSDRKSA